MLKQAGEENTARVLVKRRLALSRAIHQIFWDAKHGFYRTEISSRGEIKRRARTYPSLGFA